MARLPGIDDLKQQRQLVGDIANGLDKMVSSASSFKKQVAESSAEIKDLASALADQKAQVEASIAAGTPDQKSIDVLVKMSYEMDKLTKKGKELTSVSNLLGSSFDRLGKTMLKGFGSTAFAALDLLAEGIHRVYDLSERWAAVTGEVNQALGKLSPNMKGFWKDAKQAEGAVRGLGGELGIGVKLFTEFTQGFNAMDTDGFAKLGVQVARGFDMGGERSGKFLRVLDNLGFDERAKEGTMFMSSISTGAQTAGVSVNALAKDFGDATGFVARFGKEGAKSLVASAAYLKKFNMSLKDTEGMMNKFDTFDSAAESVAKLNVVFGTSVNALNLMLEQDPAKRFETIRQSLLDQGKSWEKMTYFEHKALEQTTGLTSEQLTAMLDVKNQGKSYTQFLAENEKKQKSAAKATADMQMQLKATAKTLYNFGAAADRITVSIANAIKPFTDMLGLTRSADKPFKSFGQVMEGITKKIILFFNTLAKNRQWREFMEKAADATKRLAVYVADFFSPDKIGKNIERVIDGLKTFAAVSAGIVAIWAGRQAVSGFNGLAEMAKNIKSIRGAQGLGANARQMVRSAYPAAVGPEAKPGRGMAALGGAVAGVGIGGGIGSAFGATKGGSIGGGLGGGVGGLFGPIGAGIGIAVGTAAGIAIEKFFKGEGSKKLESSMEGLASAQKDLALSDAKVALVHAKASERQAKWDAREKTIQEALTSGKKKGITLSEKEQEALLSRVNDAQRLGVVSKKSADLLAILGDKSGPVSLTATQIKELNRVSSSYKTTVEQLAAQSDVYLKNLFNSDELEQAKKLSDARGKVIEDEIKIAQLKKEEADQQASYLQLTKDALKAIKDGNTFAAESDRRKEEAKRQEEKVQALQAKKLEQEKKTIEINSELNKQKAAFYEIENLQRVDPKFAELVKNNDLASALEKFAGQGGHINPDTVAYIKAQARQARTAQPSVSKTTGTTANGAAAGATAIHVNVHLDKEKVGSAVAEHNATKSVRGR